MKLALMFLLLSLAFVAAESQNQVIDNERICVERGDALKLLSGRDGYPGQPGVKGDQGPNGNIGVPGVKGYPGKKGRRGEPGADTGEQGEEGELGSMGPPGLRGRQGVKGNKGDDGEYGGYGEEGDKGQKGYQGDKGWKGAAGKPGAKMGNDIEIYLLHDYSVAQSGYYNKLYHVTSRDLTDGRTDTGGWGSETAKTGNYIQATYSRPVYVTSVTVAGGYIPSWGSPIRAHYGKLDLVYSSDGNTWLKTITVPSPATEGSIFYNLSQPVTAQYWRLKSAENKWVGTTEFALKPLINLE